MATRPDDAKAAVLEATVVRGTPETLDGPAVVELAEATLVVPPGWSCAPAEDGTLVMERSEG